MASIPLPALHIQPPAPPPNPLEQYGQLLQLRNQMQEAPLRQQALQQQVQEGQIGIQQAQQGQQDQQAFRAAMQDPSMQGKSIGEVADALAQKGAISQSAWQSAMKADTEHKQSIAKLTDTQLTAAKATHDQTQELYNNVMSLPDDQLAQSWPQIAQQFNAIPGQKQQLNPQQPLSKQQLSQFGPVISMGSAYIDQQLARRKQEAQTGEANARANEATVNATLAPAKLANQQANDAVQRRQGAQRISIEQARLAFDQKKASLDQAQSGLTGEDFLKTLSPGMQAQVKVTANGDIAMPPAGTRNPQAQQLRTAVLTYDPTYTDARYKGKQNFKTSGDAQNIVQLSTAMEHADRAIANSAKAGYAPALGSKTFESGESAAYMQDAEFLTGEVGKLVKNGVLSVDEGNKISSGLTSARQGVRDSALNETMDLLGGKARAMFQKYKTSTGQDLPVSDFFDSKTQQRLTKYNVIDGSAGGSSAAQPGGSVVRYKIVNGQLVAQ